MSITVTIAHLDIEPDWYAAIATHTKTLKALFDELDLDYHKFCSVMLRIKCITESVYTFPIHVLDYIEYNARKGFIVLKICSNIFTSKAINLFEKNGFTVDANCYRRNNKEEENMYITGAKVASKYSNFVYQTENIPCITNVEIFNDNLLTVKVTFGDGSHTTATCSENDAFDFDTGIGICIAKRAIPNFNNLIKKASKLYEKKVIEKEKKAQAEDEEHERKIRKEKKRRAKAERREQEWRQEQIDILAAAIKKAREESGSEDVTHKDVFKIAAHMLKQSRERDDRNKKILELHDQGKSYGDISKELGISRTTVGRVVRESNKH